MRLILVILICAFGFLSSLDIYGQNQSLPAFPGAEGFGKYATGGRGGKVYIVTNLNDNGTGSLRWALEAKGPRIVVFEISGNIKLEKSINVGDGNLTIAGQTAPGDGITIQNYPITIYYRDNVIIRFLRFRLGDLSGKDYDSFTSRYCENLIIDHCTFSWGTDETLSVYNMKNSTVQNSIISEGLNKSIHPDGDHGFGGLWGGENISFYKNLLSHFRIRMPSITSSSNPIDLRNNVIYNWNSRATDNGANAKANLYYNYYKPGPATIASERKENYNNFLRPTSKDRDPNTYGKFYLEGNILEGRPEIIKDQWLGVWLESTSNTEKYLEQCKNKDVDGNLVPFKIPDGIYSKKLSAQEAYEEVMKNVGASLIRDTVDKRLIQEVKTGTYTFKGSKTGLLGIIDSQNDVGGWPQLISLPAPKDTDRDGMPDEWEIAYGLDPNKADDSLYSLNQEYTNLEVYINSLVAHISELDQPSTVAVSGIALDPKEFNLDVGKTQQIKAEVAPSNATNRTILWTSSNPEVATVNSSGLVTGVSIGLATITAKTQDGGFTDISNITVNELENSLAIDSFTLIDAGSNTDIQPLIQGDKLDYDLVKNISLNFRANPNTSSIGSVYFSLEGPLNSSRTDNGFTFDLLNNAGLILPLGNYKLSAIPYSEQNRGGIKGKEASIEFSIVDSNDEQSLQVKNFTLMDASDNHYLFEIYDGMQIDTELIQDLNLNIRANTNPITVGSVSLSITGPITHSTTENIAPYALFGDTNGNYNGKAFPIGNYTLEAVPYSETNKSGFMGETLSINFSVIEVEEKTVPDKPTLLTPLNKLTDLSNTIDFQWDNMEDAVSYRIQLSERSDFSTVFFNINDLETSQIQISDLNSGIQYYWRVSASNEIGYSNWSDIWTFTTKTIIKAPSSPLLLGPENLSLGLTGTVTLKWTKPENAEVYRVQIAKDAEFTRKQFDLYNIPSESFDLNNLEAGTTFYWRVNASNEGGSSDFSEIWKFETLKGPDTPNLLSPVDGQSNMETTIKLEWETVLGADSYRLQVSSFRDFSQRIVDRGNITENIFNLENLEEGKTYYWRVRASNKAGNSAYSDIWSFTTKISLMAPIAPELVSPIQSATVNATNVAFEWKAVNTAEKYQIQVSKFSNFSQQIVVNNNAVTNNKISITTLEPDQVYFWRVRAINATGSGPYSAVWLVKTEPLPPLASPLLVSPPDGMTLDTTSFVFNWEMVHEAENYQLDVSKDSTFQEGLIQYTGLSQTNYILDSLESGEKYFWRVQANGKRPSSQSEIWSFTIEEEQSVLLAKSSPVKIKAYPNPFEDIINLEFSRSIEGEVFISIMDSNGITVFEVEVSDITESISLEIPSSWPKGVYVIKVQGFGLFESKKIIKN